MEKFIKDPIHGNIKIDDSLIDNMYFQRLRHVIQNGMAYMVFPSMRHSRFEHSLGTYYIASKMVENVQASEKEIIDKKELIKELALYHDIGHFPFSHTFEFAMEILEYLNKNIYNSIIKLTGFRDMEYKLHEMMGINILRSIRKTELADLMSNAYSSKDIKEINDPLVKIAKLIVNSELDADRLDYLQRDSYYSGAKFGIIDPERLLITMKITTDGYVFPPKAIDDLEHFFLARFHMYSSVYNHPVIEIYNRIMAYFIAFAINSSLLDIPSNLEEFAEFTDEKIYLALLKVKNDNRFSHFYESLVKRKKYMRAVVEGDQAKNLFKIISSNEKSKRNLYDTVLNYYGKIVIGKSELTTEIGNIFIERKMLKESYNNPLSEEGGLTKIPERYRIYVGAYDEVSKNDILKYFNDTFGIRLAFKANS
ncbi:HD domain-containing protein [Sulfurisphaera tokodaii]|uniref:HD/PDEase domain-containing protein n=2 Tax=Sulfurisphaera tokodaii TaxID=111955 RepID=Q96Z49_SULTO|nr:HD domain-containing protein [Sulfurisphaera tokodaii]BAB67077.1 hypothetical protein STK_19830 [Sulfurisphaera tokodaii str. 7]HII73803.1 HD domain-containing protein [Sulfurisphaera tokodaii]